MIWIKYYWFCGFGQKDEESLVETEERGERGCVSNSLLSPKDRCVLGRYLRGGWVPERRCSALAMVAWFLDSVLRQKGYPT